MICQKVVSNFFNCVDHCQGLSLGSGVVFLRRCEESTGVRYGLVGFACGILDEHGSEAQIRGIGMDVKFQGPSRDNEDGGVVRYQIDPNHLAGMIRSIWALLY